MALTLREKTFLLKLAELCKEYAAAFSCTVDDDGVHICVDEEEVFVGFLDAEAGDASDQLIDQLIDAVKNNS